MTSTMYFSFMGIFRNLAVNLTLLTKYNDAEVYKNAPSSNYRERPGEKNFPIGLNEIGQKNSHPPGNSKEPPIERGL